MLALAAIGSATAYAVQTRNEVVCTTLNAQDACVTVGNVTATVDGKGQVFLQNGNSYTVFVSYTVTALTSDYRRIEVGGGSVTLGRAGDGSACIARVDTTSGFSGYSVTIKVQKCS